MRTFIRRSIVFFLVCCSFLFFSTQLQARTDINRKTVKANENTRDTQIVITPKLKAIVQRCFMEYDHKKRTFCAAVGDPDKINYAMDLSEGALINFWKGGFIDATSMWTDRGEQQIAVPLGAKLEMAPYPNFALLTGDKAVWPETQSDKFKFKGYKLDTHGRPTFLYQLSDFSIEDKIEPQENGKFLSRTYKITAGKNTNLLWFKLAEGVTIKKIAEDLYSVNNNSYYIKCATGKSSKAILRKTSTGQELIVPLSGSKNQTEIKYAIIW